MRRQTAPSPDEAELTVACGAEPPTARAIMAETLPPRNAGRLGNATLVVKFRERPIVAPAASVPGVPRDVGFDRDLRLGRILHILLGLGLGLGLVVDGLAERCARAGVKQPGRLELGDARQ